MFFSRRLSKWLPSFLIAKSAASLGRLVLDPVHPESCYIDTIESDKAGSTDRVSEIRVDSFQTTTTEAESYGLSVLLTSLLGATYKTRLEKNIDITADGCTTRSLNDPYSSFQCATNRNDVVNWLHDAWKKRKTVYYITGIQTLTDANIKFGTAATIEGGLNLQLPTSVTVAAATSGAVIIPGCDAMDLEVSLSMKKEPSQESSGFIAGEHIYAIQYRKVRFSWLKPPKRSNTGLIPHDWKIFIGTRGGTINRASDSDSESSEDEERLLTLVPQLSPDDTESKRVGLCTKMDRGPSMMN